MTYEFSIQTSSNEEFVDLTGRIERLLQTAKTKSGTVMCYVPHTTAGITINENADPDVRHDLLYKLSQLVPKADSHYRHAEGNSDAHVKASLMGFTVQVPFEDGRLLLGTWQAVYFCEFDGPRNRRLVVKVMPDA